MNEFITSGLKGLPYEQLMAIVTDCEQRIGSNVAGGMPNEAYVEQQKQLIGAVQKEIESR